MEFHVNENVCVCLIGLYAVHFDLWSVVIVPDLTCEYLINCLSI